MDWTIGSAVVVLPLANKRGVIVEAGSGRYRVRVEGVTIWCREQELAAPAGPEKKPRKTAAGDTGGEPSAARHDEPARPGRVDLHGLRVEEALARVTTEIDRAIMRGADRLEIVHGKGTGALKKALDRHLASIAVVAAFRTDPHTPGVTWVHF